MSAAPSRPPVRVLLGVGLVAGSTLALQVLLTRVLFRPARIPLTIALLAPLAFALGMAMPLGLRRLERLYPRGVAWACGIHGIASVLASVLAITVAIMFGFTAATLLALACYLVALGHALWGRWPAGGQERAHAVANREPAGVA